MFWPVAILLTTLGVAVIGEAVDHPGYETRAECESVMKKMGGDIMTKGVGPIKPDMIYSGDISCQEEDAISIKEKLEQKAKGQDV